MNKPKKPSKLKDSPVMTPAHSRWAEFTSRLEGPEGCNFTQSDPKDTSTMQWTCDGTMARPKARKILESMKGVDVEASLAYFDGHGGYCDCEILFNV